MSNKIYIAGPMTGLPEHNRPAFHEAAALLRSHGFDVLNPAELDESENAGEIKPWEYYLRRDLGALLAQCDKVAFLPGWQHSRGARLERYVSKAIGLQCMPLRFWLHNAAS
jgi:hypothetical protein